MELDTSNFYLLIWFALIAIYLFVLSRIITKERTKAEDKNEDFDFFTNKKVLKFGLGGVILVVLYAMVMPFHSNLDGSKEAANFTNTFEKVTEEDRVRHGVDLSDEARSDRLEELRLQRQKISEEVAEEYENSQNDETKGDS